MAGAKPRPIGSIFTRLLALLLRYVKCDAEAKQRCGPP
jgi:hypothetical protein